MAGSGLALDERGFVLTGPTLQSVSHAFVLAAGDVATHADAPARQERPACGACRPTAAAEPAPFVAGSALQPHQPQQRTLNLICCGDRRAIAARGGWSSQGRWVWCWKDRFDRTFVARYGAPAEATAS